MAMARSKSIRFEDAQSLRFSSARYAPAVTKEQKQAIHFVWLPTEFGKSVCFQTLPFVFDFKHSIVGASN